MRGYKLLQLKNKPFVSRQTKLLSNFWRNFVFFFICVVIVIYYTIEIDHIKNEVFETTKKGFEESKASLTVLNSKDPLLKLKKSEPVSKLIKPEKYFVLTENCKIPWIDPFNVNASKIFHRENYTKCSNEKSLVRSEFDVNQRRYILQFDFEDQSDIKCCYKQIERSGTGARADEKYKLSPCISFDQNFVVPLNVEFMIVNCSSTKDNRTIQLDAFSFIQDKFPQMAKNSSENFTTKPNVLLIGIDSLSRMNFRRNMPKTAEYLMRNKWFELEGYNKVGDNTFPNLMPFLVGITEETADTLCTPKKVEGLDKCPFVWKSFKEHGYLTSYAEDITWMSSFNYLKKGFFKPPTDFYLRPMLLAIEDELPTTTKAGLTFCIGQRHYANYVYDYGLEFANRFQNNSKFGLFWTNSFSHNYYATPSSMDEGFLPYFEKMESTGVMDNSIIILFSDHGSRWGSLMDLPEGFLEERLPMFFIWLPKKFRDAYPELVKALDINRNRLTTPFDIYQTFNHILSLESRGTEKINASISCPTAQSIFYEIPETRTCEDACIPVHWCTCKPYEILPTNNPHVKKVSKLIVNEINDFLTMKNLSSLCSELQVKSISKAEVQIDDPENMSDIETFRIKNTVQPGNAEFQTTALFNLHNESITVIIDDISRLDSYAANSYCIDDKSAKKFCICKESKPEI